MKKHLSLFLAVLMVIGIFPIFALTTTAAGGSGGTGRAASQLLPLAEATDTFPQLVITELVPNSVNYGTNADNWKSKWGAIGETLPSSTDLYYEPIRLVPGQSLTTDYYVKSGTGSYTQCQSGQVAESDKSYYRLKKLKDCSDVFKFMEVCNTGSSSLNLYDYKLVLDPEAQTENTVVSYAPLLPGNLQASFQKEKGIYNVVNPAEAILQPGDIALIWFYSETDNVAGLTVEQFKKYYEWRYQKDNFGKDYKVDLENVVVIAVNAITDTLSFGYTEESKGFNLLQNGTAYYGIVDKEYDATLDTARESNWVSYVRWAAYEALNEAKVMAPVSGVIADKTVVTSYAVKDTKTGQYIPVSCALDVCNSDGTAKKGITYYSVNLAQNSAFSNILDQTSTNFLYGLDAGTSIKEGRPYTVSSYAMTPGFLEPIQKAAFLQRSGKSQPDLVISEVMPNDTVNDAYEFLEVVNTSGGMVNVFDYSIVVRTSSYIGCYNQFFNKVNPLIPGDYGNILSANTNSPYFMQAPVNARYEEGWLAPGEVAVIWSYTAASYTQNADFNTFRSYYGMDIKTKIFAMDADNSATGRPNRQNLANSGFYIYGIINDSNLSWYADKYTTDVYFKTHTYDEGQIPFYGYSLEDCESFVLAPAPLVCGINSGLGQKRGYQYVYRFCDNSSNRIGSLLDMSTLTYYSSNTEFSFAGNVANADDWVASPGKLIDAQKTAMLTNSGKQKYVLYMEQSKSFGGTNEIETLFSDDILNTLRNGSYTLSFNLAFDGESSEKATSVFYNYDRNAGSYGQVTICRDGTVSNAVCMNGTLQKVDVDKNVAAANEYAVTLTYSAVSGMSISINGTTISTPVQDLTTAQYTDWAYFVETTKGTELAIKTGDTTNVVLSDILLTTDCVNGYASDMDYPSLYITEVLAASSKGVSYFEIFNATGNTVDLKNYSLLRTEKGKLHDGNPTSKWVEAVSLEGAFGVSTSQLKPNEIALIFVGTESDVTTAKEWLDVSDSTLCGIITGGFALEQNAAYAFAIGRNSIGVNFSDRFTRDYRVIESFVNYNPAISGDANGVEQDYPAHYVYGLDYSSNYKAGMLFTRRNEKANEQKNAGQLYQLQADSFANIRDLQVNGYAQGSGLVITEILNNTSDLCGNSYDAFEAIEITNTSNTPINLYNYSICATDDSTYGCSQTWSYLNKLSRGPVVGTNHQWYKNLKDIENPSSCMVEPGESVVVWIYSQDAIASAERMGKNCLTVDDFRNYYANLGNAFIKEETEDGQYKVKVLISVVGDAVGRNTELKNGGSYLYGITTANNITYGGKLRTDANVSYVMNPSCATTYKLGWKKISFNLSLDQSILDDVISHIGSFTVQQVTIDQCIHVDDDVSNYYIERVYKPCQIGDTAVEGMTYYQLRYYEKVTEDLFPGSPALGYYEYDPVTDQYHLCDSVFDTIKADVDYFIAVPPTFVEVTLPAGTPLEGYSTKEETASLVKCNEGEKAIRGNIYYRENGERLYFADEYQMANYFKGTELSSAIRDEIYQEGQTYYFAKFTWQDDLVEEVDFGRVLSEGDDVTGLYVYADSTFVKCPDGETAKEGRRYFAFVEEENRYEFVPFYHDLSVKDYFIRNEDNTYSMVVDPDGKFIYRKDVEYYRLNFYTNVQTSESEPNTSTNFIYGTALNGAWNIGALQQTVKIDSHNFNVAGEITSGQEQANARTEVNVMTQGTGQNTLGYLVDEQMGMLTSNRFTKIGNLEDGTTLYYYHTLTNGASDVTVSVKGALVGEDTKGANILFLAGTDLQTYEMLVQLFGEENLKMDVLTARAADVAKANEFSVSGLVGEGFVDGQEFRFDKEIAMRAMTVRAGCIAMPSNYYMTTFSAKAYLTVNTALGVVKVESANVMSASVTQVLVTAMADCQDAYDEEHPYQVETEKGLQFSRYTADQMERFQAIINR